MPETLKLTAKKWGRSCSHSYILHHVLLLIRPAQLFLVDLLWKRRGWYAKNSCTFPKVLLCPHRSLPRRTGPRAVHTLVWNHGHECSFFVNQSDARHVHLNGDIRSFLERTFQKAVIKLLPGLPKLNGGGQAGGGMSISVIKSQLARIKLSCQSLPGLFGTAFPAVEGIVTGSKCTCMPAILPHVMIFQGTWLRRLPREQLSLPHTMPVPRADRNSFTILNNLLYRSVGIESYFTNTSCSVERQLLCVI